MHNKIVCLLVYLKLKFVFQGAFKMAAPMGHDWKRKETSEEEEEEDPVETMIKKTGCIEKHYAVQVRIILNLQNSYKSFVKGYWKAFLALSPIDSDIS